jgi:transcriptional regulator with XRE-family HTH domain
MVTRLKVAIIASGLKQTHIARKIGVDYYTLSHYVRGERECPPDVLKAIAIVLGRSPIDLEGVVDAD